MERDEWGIPHITASCRHDLFFTQGFVHAQDRLWQMEISRRAARGKLSALFGPIGLDTDRLTRTLGFAHLAEDAWNNASDKVRSDVEAYATGVNSYINDDHPLPIEFSLLRHKPDPWEPLDSAAFARLMVWTLSHGWAGELTRAKIIEKAGPELAAELEPHYPPANPITLPGGIEFNLLKADGMIGASSGPFLSRGPEGSGRGSNGWVVSASRSATGHAILCNDVHLPMTTPSIWYHNHLRTIGTGAGDRNIHVVGASLPGIPYVIIGHNQFISWGATLSFVDCEDLFVERFDLERPTRYRFMGTWNEADIREEHIEVKGSEDHIEKVITTRHGPVISPVLEVGGEALSLQSTALHPSESFDGFALLNEARDWDGFVSAVRRIETPALNLLYADRKDNIGYYLSGKVPVRASGTGVIPSPAWSGDFEWTGYVPFEEMPHAFNPREGYLVTANNRIVDDDFPHFLGSLWMNGYRAQRIADLLTDRHLISVPDCEQMQMDMMSIPGIELVGSLASFEVTDPDAILAMQLLRDWDGRLGVGSIGGSVYQVFAACLSDEILTPILGRELAQEYLGRGPHPILMPITEFHGQWISTLLRAIGDSDSPLWKSAGGHTDTIRRCLTMSVAELRRLLGDDPAAWGWGRLHRITFDHVMEQRPPLGEVFSLGPYPVGGDTNTVHQTAIAPANLGGSVALAPSYRQIIDLGDPGLSQAMYAPGQSGHLGSRFHNNLVQPWFHGEYFPMTAGKDKNETLWKLNLLPAENFG